MEQYIVDAFTSQPFSGNPAAVCLMDTWPREEAMMKLAMENNLSETAFLVREGEGYRLRWFTPGTEVDLCGHATLASAFVVLTCCETEKDTVVLPAAGFLPSGKEESSWTWISLWACRRKSR